MRRTRSTSVLTALAAVFAVLMANVAFADVVSNTVSNSISETVSVAAGSSVDVDYSVRNTNTNTNQAPYIDTQNSCNATDGTTLTITPSQFASAKTGVNACEPSTFRITFTVPSGTAPGNYLIGHTFSDSGTGVYYNEANFTLQVTAPADPCASVANPAAPVFSAGLPNGSNGWFTSVPSAAATSTTTGAVITYATDGTTFSSTVPTLGEGTTTVTAKATDANCSGKTSTSSRTFKVDTVAPEINPADVTNTTWRNTNLSQAFTASDDTSGLADSADASFTLTASTESTDSSTPTVDSKTVFDNAGNSTTRTLSALIDKTAPVVTPASVNDTTWRKSSLSQAFSASDPLSGLATPADASFTLTASAESADASTPTTVSKTVMDNAGNSTTRSVSAMIDLTKPVNSVTGPADGTQYVLGQTIPTAGCQTTDGLSGVATTATPSSVNNTTVGSKTVTCSGGTDNAGNQADPASVTYSVIYAFTGFFSPVDNLPTRNTVKAGRAIPVKFKLGGDMGMDIFGGAGSRHPNAGKQPVSTSLTCTTGSLDAVEETLTAGGSSLQYDSLTQTYTYVWKTESSWANKCRTFELNLNDGTSHQFAINVLK